MGMFFPHPDCPELQRDLTSLITCMEEETWDSDCDCPRKHRTVGIGSNLDFHDWNEILNEIW